MADIVLHVGNNNEVSSPSSLEVLIGQPAERLMIFSGIACPEISCTDDEHNYPFDVEVFLGVHVSAIVRWTAQVGLASIFNEETSFLFATDSAVLDVEKDTGELKLKVHTVIRGDVSRLHRFSYQIVAVVNKVAARISGSVRVPKSVLDASRFTQGDLDALIRVSANREVPTAPDPNGQFPQFQTLQPVSAGRLTGVRSTTRDSFVDYEIDNCPFREPIYVEVARGAELLRRSTIISQVAGPRPVVLTNVAPEANGVDFAVSQTVVK